MIIAFGVQNPFPRSLVSLVEQAVSRKHRLRLTPVQKPIQCCPPDRDTPARSARLSPPTQGRADSPEQVLLQTSFTPRSANGVAPSCRSSGSSSPSHVHSPSKDGRSRERPMG